MLTRVSFRRLRNRLSQQAFRKRQATYIQELEKRVQLAGKTENERIAALEEENRILREKLGSVFGKINSIRGSLGALALSVDQVLVSRMTLSVCLCEKADWYARAAKNR